MWWGRVVSAWFCVGQKGCASMCWSFCTHLGCERNASPLQPSAAMSTMKTMNGTAARLPEFEPTCTMLCPHYTKRHTDNVDEKEKETTRTPRSSDSRAQSSSLTCKRCLPWPFRYAECPSPLAVWCLQEGATATRHGELLPNTRLQPDRHITQQQESQPQQPPPSQCHRS